MSGLYSLACAYAAGPALGRRIALEEAVLACKDLPMLACHSMVLATRLRGLDEALLEGEVCSYSLHEELGDALAQRLSDVCAILDYPDDGHSIRTFEAAMGGEVLRCGGSYSVKSQRVADMRACIMAPALLSMGYGISTLQDPTSLLFLWASVPSIIAGLAYSERRAVKRPCAAVADELDRRTAVVLENAGRWA